ncbi:MAG: SdiA-regulated domain-containing protein [Myxococcales bacterium]|nr:SdiA-regulated domain-containing protein [Myxococcales bacterium]
MYLICSRQTRSWFQVGFFCLVGWFVLCAASPRKAPPTTRPASRATSTPYEMPVWDAKLVHAFSLRGDAGARRFDASGLGLDPLGRGLITVNDKPQKIGLFLLPVSLDGHHKGLQSLSPATLGVREQILPIKKLYQGKRTLRGKVDPVWKVRHYLDLEGVASCQGHVLMIAEQQRVLFRLDLKTRRWTKHPIPTKSYEELSARLYRPMPRFSRSPNAGYEGIACDEKRGRIYLIQERQPRLVLSAELPASWKDGQPLKVVGHFDMPAQGLPRYEGDKEIPTDFSGGHVDGDALFLLSRNEYAILKVDLQKKRLLGKVHYRHLEEKLFQTNEPYGLAEGLVVSGKRIWLVFDNNGRRRLGRPSDRAPVLLEIERPSGF